MATGHNLSSKDETPTIEQKKYKSMIGGLEYLTHSRSYIANVDGMVAIFQANPKEYSDIWKEHQIMVFGMTEIVTLLFALIQMLIGQETRIIVKELVEEHFSLEED